jgi:hypothetical protein
MTLKIGFGEGMAVMSLLRSVVLFFLAFGLIEIQAQDRPASVAGQFYDQDPGELHQQVTALLATARQPARSNYPVVALIVPHAGYKYSGATAARAYQLLQGQSFDTIILIGPQHRKYVPGAAVWPAGQWQTPLGGVVVDKDFVQALIAAESRIIMSEELHYGEHSLEVQLPFLQVVQPQAAIVPIVVDDHAFAQPLAAALIKVIRAFPAKRFLVIASTDMTHDRPESLTRAHDQQTLKLIKDLDTCGLARAFEAKESELCGAAAVLTVLTMLQAMPKAVLTPLMYATSVDGLEDKTHRVVGYGATMAEGPRWQEAHTQTPFVLTLAQKKQLMTIARQTLTSYINEGKTPEFPIDPAFRVPMAVFVTLRDAQGALRGCIGRIYPEEFLDLAVQLMTIESAVKDRRFPPVRPDEVDSLTIEISILSYPQRVCTIDAIHLGTHGIILKRDKYKGVFLPEVAKSYPLKEDFLEELCGQKAKLERNCWRDLRVQMDTFTSLHFSEKELNG